MKLWNIYFFSSGTLGSLILKLSRKWYIRILGFFNFFPLYSQRLFF